MPLNPKLYQALVKRFGEVKISNQGVKYVGKKVKKSVKGKLIDTIKDVNRGEQYCVNCPSCGGKKKLTISYINGTAPPPYTEKVWHKIHCFKCGYGKRPGTKDALKELLANYAQIAERANILINTDEVVEKIELEQPGGLKPLGDDTAAGIYVKKRGFDPEHLMSTYNMKRIAKPLPGKGYLQDYLFIPMYARGELISWQARAVFPKQEPRWYISSGGKKPIFNLDLAAQTSCIIIQEGIFDAIACGNSGVAIMGKYLTNYQTELLSEIKKPIIVCLDPDASKDAKRLYYQLKETHFRLVTLFKYPENWPTEFDVNKNKEIPKDAAAVGKDVMLPLLKEHYKNHYK